jgi:hypothetical protein
VDEINAFGKNIQNIDISLRQYWAIRFPEDPIGKVYVVYFLESKGYHLHIHLIPRTMELGQGDPQVYMAWKTSERTAREDFPKKYRLRNKESKKNEIEINKHEVVALMTYLKGCLWKLSTN